MTSLRRISISFSIILILASSAIAKLSDLDVVALTIFHEAASEPNKGHLAVASVIFNRANYNPDKLRSVCLAKKQFSCWNNAKLTVPNDHISRLVYLRLRCIAEDMLNGTFIPTTRATHYLRYDCYPKWRYKLIKLNRIGNHVFLIEV